MGRGQSGQRRRPRGSGIDIGRVEVFAQILAPEPDHGRSRQPMTVGEGQVRGRIEAWLEDRIDQDLRVQRGTTPVACFERHGRSQVAARAVAGDDQAARIAPQLGGVFRDILGCREAVVQRGRIPVFRSAPVRDRHNQGVRGDAQSPAKRVVRVQVAENPAAAVKIHDDGQRRRGRRGIKAHGHGVRDRPVLDTRYDGPLAKQAGQTGEHLTPFRGGHLVPAGSIAFPECVEKLLDLRVQRHRVFFLKSSVSTDGSCRSRELPGVSPRARSLMAPIGCVLTFGAHL